jgi:hypothetical protein
MPGDSKPTYCGHFTLLGPCPACALEALLTAELERDDAIKARDFWKEANAENAQRGWDMEAQRDAAQAKLSEVEWERDQNFARLELAEDECRRTHDRVEWWKRRWDEAQAKLSEVERERKRFWEVADILVNTVCECDSRIRGYECCYNDSDARRLAIELLSPSGGKDSSGSIQVVTSESVPDDTVLFVKDGKEVGRIENLDSSGEDRGEGGE